MRRRFVDEDPEQERRAGLRYVLFQLRAAAFALGCLIGIFTVGKPLLPDGGAAAVVAVFAIGGVGVAVFELIRWRWARRNAQSWRNP